MCPRVIRSVKLDSLSNYLGYSATVSRVQLEFTIEPFTEGKLGEHVVAALDSLRAAGFEPEVGPFGNSVEGDAEVLFETVGRAALAAIAAGAVALSISAQVVNPPLGDVDDLLVAILPVVSALGGRLVDRGDLTPEDVPLRWKGQIVAGVQIRDVNDLHPLGDLVDQIESELGGCLADLSRVNKQKAVRLLDERGVFALRNAVEQIADSMGVSRATIYNYLNTTRASASPERRIPGRPATRLTEARASHQGSPTPS